MAPPPSGGVGEMNHAENGGLGGAENQAAAGDAGAATNGVEQPYQGKVSALIGRVCDLTRQSFAYDRSQTRLLKGCVITTGGVAKREKARRISCV